MPSKRKRNKKNKSGTQAQAQAQNGLNHQNIQTVQNTRNTQNTDNTDNSSTSSSIDLPRFSGKYGKLIARFYEPLILLFVLGKTRGDFEPTRHSRDKQGLRRQFRDDLAFLCEYEKGGDACTAIGLEDCPNNIVYWVAANVNPARIIVPFLKSMLEDLNEASHLSGEDRDAIRLRLIDRYLGYAQKKLKKQISFLRMNIESCRKSPLLNTHHPADRELRTLLDRVFDATEQVLKTNPVSNATDNMANLCRTACAFKRTGYMVRLRELGQDDATNFNDCFLGARHYIGRFANSIRVPDRLFRRLGNPHIEHLVQMPFEVAAVDTPPYVPTPQVDKSTTLEGILRRMLPSNDPQAASLLTNFQDMDRLHNILRRIENEYDKKKFKPRVHAEVQVLEHFYQRNLRWFDNDIFVGCTKPACFCCRLYFRHHPLRPFVPGSHQKLYANWGLAHLPEGEDHPQFGHQLYMLNKMVEDIRRDAIQQIHDMRSPHLDHADSRTGITSTVADEVLFHIQRPSRTPSLIGEADELSRTLSPFENGDFDPPAVDLAALSPASSWSSSADGGLVASREQFATRNEDEDEDGGAVV